MECRHHSGISTRPLSGVLEKITRPSTIFPLTILSILLWECMFFVGLYQKSYPQFSTALVENGLNLIEKTSGNQGALKLSENIMPIRFCFFGHFQTAGVALRCKSQAPALFYDTFFVFSATLGGSLFKDKDGDSGIADI